jgi:anhydro-N-acetylmuramic acid kinase
MRMIGLMSGTSLDGVDAVLADFDARGQPTLAGQWHQPYPDDLLAGLRDMDGDTPLRTVLAQDARLADVYADAVEALLGATGVERTAVAGIALHGQTLWHAPAADPPVSYQAGDPSRLAEATGLDVIADFRQRDLAAGGEGAPLAPLFHSALFGNDAPRNVINIGGVANISVLGAGGRVHRGFDTGPGNGLMDAWTRRHRDAAFDEDGQWAAAGQVDRSCLERLLTDAYFHRPPPKSLDVHTFDLAWVARHCQPGALPVDIQATLLALTAESIARAVEDWGENPADIVLTGGGARNPVLRQALARCLAPRPVITSDALGIDCEWVEALGFAWLGRATLRREPQDLAAITGSGRPVILGGIYPGRPPSDTE